MRAYSLMRHARELEASYLASSFATANKAHIEGLRRTLRVGDFSLYRGIGRRPFDDVEIPPSLQSEVAEYDHSESEARRVANRLLGPNDYLTPHPRWLVSLDHAQQVYEALSRPERYEIVELCTSPDHPTNCLGYDIGYWGGGDFSILCDAVIWPWWHPPAPESYAALAEATSVLNQHVLFPTGESAQCYLDWYAEQPWAEKPPEDFTVMAVGAWGE